MVYNNTISPLDQFEIRDYIELNLHIFEELKISLTNISMYLILGSFVILLLNLVNTDFTKIISDK